MAEEVEIDIEQCKRDTQMMENVKEFLKGGCKCSRGPKDSPCSSQFTEEEIVANLNNCHELFSRELDLVRQLPALRRLDRKETEVLAAVFSSSQSPFAMKCFFSCMG